MRHAAIGIRFCAAEGELRFAVQPKFELDRGFLFIGERTGLEPNTTHGLWLRFGVEAEQASGEYTPSSTPPVSVIAAATSRAHAR